MAENRKLTISTLLPAIGVAFLPKLACPACWPAYAGLLSSLGIGFFDYTPYLLPATIVFLALALFALLFRASTRRGFTPFFIGLVGSLTLLVGNFMYNKQWAMYTGLIILIGASIWNSWPAKSATQCAACKTTD